MSLSNDQPNNLSANLQQASIKPSSTVNLTSSDALSVDKMSPVEMRATISLASIYGLRMLGMFLILPIMPQPYRKSLVA